MRAEVSNLIKEEEEEEEDLGCCSCSFPFSAFFVVLEFTCLALSACSARRLPGRTCFLGVNSESAEEAAESARGGLLLVLVLVLTSFKLRCEMVLILGL